MCVFSLNIITFTDYYSYIFCSSSRSARKVLKLSFYIELFFKKQLLISFFHLYNMVASCQLSSEHFCTVTSDVDFWSIFRWSMKSALKKLIFFNFLKFDLYWSIILKSKNRFLTPLPVSRYHCKSQAWTFVWSFFWKSAYFW